MITSNNIYGYTNLGLGKRIEPPEKGWRILEEGEWVPNVHWIYYALSDFNDDGWTMWPYQCRSTMTPIWAAQLGPIRAIAVRLDDTEWDELPEEKKQKHVAMVKQDNLAREVKCGLYDVEGESDMNNYLCGLFEKVGLPNFPRMFQVVGDKNAGKTTVLCQAIWEHERFLLSIGNPKPVIFVKLNDGASPVLDWFFEHRFHNVIVIEMSRYNLLDLKVHPDMVGLDYPIGMIVLDDLNLTKNDIENVVDDLYPLCDSLVFSVPFLKLPGCPTIEVTYPSVCKVRGFSDTPHLTRRETNALMYGYKYGGIDGDDHKNWTIDQMVRSITETGYEAFVKDATAGEDGPDTYTWETGTAP